jgi:hypothetical protein
MMLQDTGVNVVELASLRKQVAQRRRIRDLKEAYGLNFYEPHKKQDLFHSNGHVTGRYCRFGNRTGKTKCGAVEDVSWLVGGRLFYRESFDIVDGQRNVSLAR